MTELNQLEERARTLLHAAAETVDVGPGVDDVVRRRPVWPMVAAAAVVAALLVSVPLLVTGDRDPEPAPPPAPTSVTVPQTLYMTTEQATETLEAAGLDVALRNTAECVNPLGRAHSSDPRAGASVPAGSTVRVDIEQGGGEGICDHMPGFFDAPSLLDLARFGTTDLEFAPTVRIWVDGEVTQTLTAEQAVDPEAWGDPSPLTRLVTRLSDRLVTGIDRGRHQPCGPDDPPADLRGREASVIDPIGPVDGIFGCSLIRVYRSAGLVTDVTSADWSPTMPAGQTSVPLKTVVLDDGRRIELIGLPGAEWSCVEIQGVDEEIRSCVPPPSERIPAVTAAISAWAIAQRNESSPYEVYGTTSSDVARVVVRFSGNEQQANLLRVTDLNALEQAGIAEAFGLYFAELPPGTTAEDVRAVAFDASGEQLGTADFSSQQDAPPDSMIGGRPQK